MNGTPRTKNIDPDLLGETLRRTVKARLSAATLSQADAAAFISVSEKHLSQMLTGAVDGSLAMWGRLLTFVNARLVEQSEPVSADDNAPEQAREVEVVARLLAVRLGVDGQPAAERRHLTLTEAERILRALAPIRAAERQEAAREALQLVRDHLAGDFSDVDWMTLKEWIESGPPIRFDGLTRREVKHPLEHAKYRVTSRGHAKAGDTVWISERQDDGTWGPEREVTVVDDAQEARP